MSCVPYLRTVAALALGPLAAVALAGAPAAWTGIVDRVPVRVEVLPRGHDIDAATQAEEPWWAWGDTTSDAYAFTFREADAPQLIVAFDEADGPGGAFARLYVAEPGETLVHAFDGETLRVEAEPYLEIRTLQGGWIVDGVTNYDLSLTVHGPRDVDSDYPLAAPLRRTFEVRTAEPGVPGVQTMRLDGLDPRERGIRRFTVSQRTDDAPPFRVAAPFMPTFPVLGVGRSGTYNSWWVENPPPVLYDLGLADLELNNFVGFQEAGIYRISSTSLPPGVDFEAPFAFYGFLDDIRQPQMLVRADSFPFDPEGPVAFAVERPRSSFRYAWRTDSETEWRYTLHLAGPIAYEHEHVYAGTPVRAPDYDEAPGWVLDQAWPAVTFVEAMDGYFGSEGIYFYTVQGDAPWPWLSGAELTPPAFLDEPYLPAEADLTMQSLQGLPDGFRGEYHATYERPVELYVSPVDGRVHLLGAEAGVWNLGAGEVVRTSDEDGDGYVDTWRRELVPPAETDPDGEPTVPRARDGVVEELLYLRDGQAVWVSADGARTVAIDRPLAPRHVAPPRDEAGWRAFRALAAELDAAAPTPASFEPWLARLSDAVPRALDATAAAALGEAGLEVPALEAQWTARAAVLDAPVALEPGRIAVTVRNIGSVASEARVDLHVGEAGDVVAQAVSQRVLAPAEEAELVAVYLPREAGNRTLVARMDGQEVARVEVTVAARSRRDVGAVFAGGWFPAPLVWVLVGIVSLVTVGGAVTAGRPR